jgi:VWFA-related protein
MQTTRHPHAKAAFPLTLLAVLFTASIIPLAAQKAQKSQAPAQTPTVLKSTTHLVQLNVIVEDHKGQPVFRLKKEDFSLVDEDSKQEIAIFSPASPSNAPALPPNVFTNREAPDGSSSAVSVILLDSLNTSFEDQVFAKSQVLKLLRNRQPNEYIALYFLDDQLYILQDFTRDAQALLQAMDRLKPRSSRAFDASTSRGSALTPAGDTNLSASSPASNRDQSASTRTTMDDALDTRVGDTTNAFLSIANHVAFISGRKSLVWVSGTFPLMAGYGGFGLPPPSADPHSNASEIERAARALNRVNMSIYPVDAVGISISGSRGAFFGRHAKWDAMNLLADGTGGRAFYGNNDVAGSVRRAIEDTELAYLLGFYPSHNQWDGSFHRLKLRLNVPGLQLRYREGYFAYADSSDDLGEMQTNLAQAASMRVDSTSLNLRVTLPPKGPSSSRLLRTFVRVEPSELLFRESDGAHLAALDLLVCQRGSADEFLSADHKHVDLHLKPSEYDFYMKSGLVLGNPIQVSPAARTLRIFVRDSSGALGSVTIPLAKYLSSVPVNPSNKHPQPS